MSDEEIVAMMSPEQRKLYESFASDPIVFDPEQVERQQIDSSTAQWFWDDYSKTDAVKATDYDQLLESFKEQSLILEGIRRLADSFEDNPQKKNYGVQKTEPTTAKTTP